MLCSCVKCIASFAPCRSRRTWTLEEQNLFKRLYKIYRKDFKLYVPHFDGRTQVQIKSFYQNVVHKNKQIQSYRIESQTVNQDKHFVNSIDSVQSQNAQVGLNESESLFELSTLQFDNLDLQQ
ncbi:Conserved_hypothetical protein [Hexamita inflata]|uniref:HTH myb-type domain-containing protein n=1 Tax=Hexamita inflata TaxID=28002 RepID=A0AA86Q7V4_9EUKA|nr:Conserved hypothetical protein [Hexamita inflata]